MIELLVTMAATAVIIPIMLGFILGVIRGSSQVSATVTGVQQDQTASAALLTYLHGASVILPGSDATYLSATILAGTSSSSSYTPETATLDVTLNTRLGTLTTSLAPDGGTATSVGTYDVYPASSGFTYWYYNDGSLTSTTAPTSAELSEIIAVGIQVTFLAGNQNPNPAPGYQGVRKTNFVTTIYLQNASGAPAPVTTLSLAAPTNPAVNTAATVTATVSPIPSGGSVTFTVSYGGAALSVCPSAVDVSTSTGTATCTFTPTSTGSYSVNATYSGSSGDQPSTAPTITFNVPVTTTTALTYTATESSGRVALTATVTSSSGTPTGSVTFTLTPSRGSALTETVTLSSGTASWTASGLSNKTTYTATAAYGGSSTYEASTSSTVTINW